MDACREGRGHCAAKENRGQSHLQLTKDFEHREHAKDAVGQPMDMIMNYRQRGTHLAEAPQPCAPVLCHHAAV